MSINQYRNEDLMNSRYIASEAKNRGDNLTHANKGLDSSHGAAFQSVSNIKSDTEMAKVAVDVDSMAYFDDLLNEVPN